MREFDRRGLLFEDRIGLDFEELDSNDLVVDGAIAHTGEDSERFLISSLAEQPSRAVRDEDGANRQSDRRNSLDDELRKRQSNIKLTGRRHAIEAVSEM